MHRVIMDAPKGMHVDHINGNGLDNRRENLRLCTNSQNHMNRKTHRDSSSKYKGVSWNKRNSKWQAYIGSGIKRKNLGYFASESDAAKAYDIKAKECFGEFARLNLGEI